MGSVDANEMALAAGAATGVQFAPVTGEQLEFALQSADLRHHDGYAVRLKGVNALPSEGFADRQQVEALVRLPHHLVMLVGQAWLPEGAEVTPDHEHDDHAWWPPAIDDWPPAGLA